MAYLWLLLVFVFSFDARVQQLDSNETNPSTLTRNGTTSVDLRGIDTNKLFIFGCIMVPLSVLIGIASATVGFTAWNIIVPLLWIGFDVDLYDSLFISIFVDLINGLTLSVIYSAQSEVNFKLGLIFGGIASGTAVGCLWASRALLNAFQDYIKKGVGYLVLVLALTFVIRGYKQWRVQQEADQLALTSPQPDEANALVNAKRVYDHSPMRLFLMGVASVISGAISGLAGFGSGMNFVMAFLYILRLSLLEATGTGCFVMAMIMFSVASGYLLGIMELRLWYSWPYLVIASSGSLIGTMIGAVVSFKISPFLMNFVIAVILLLVGLVAVLEPWVIHWIEG